MSTLVFNSLTGRYEGETLTVDADVFSEVIADAIPTIMRDGTSEDEAREKATKTALIESEWCEGMEGVELV